MKVPELKTLLSPVKKFTVSFVSKGSRLDDRTTDSLKAENEDDAYEKFVSKYRKEHLKFPFRMVRVKWVEGSALKEKQFPPPHFEGHEAPTEMNITNAKPNPKVSTVRKKSELEKTNTSELNNLFKSQLAHLEQINKSLIRIKWIVLGVGCMIAIPFIVISLEPLF